MKAFITLALFYLLATSAFAASNIKLYGDLEFSDGTKQTTAIVQGPVGLQGAPGTNSLNSLILLVAEVSGANCTNGGVKIQTGLDLNRDGALNTNEVTQTKYICNGSATVTYSNATLSGNWIARVGTMSPVYLSFDGNATITDFSGIDVVDMVSPAGIYQVNSNGTTLMWIQDKDKIIFLGTGTLTSSTSGTITFNNSTGTLNKVSDLAL
jgi:hypothetical protein